MNTIITAVTGVFSAVADWFITFVPNVMTLFYTAEAGLSLLGVLVLMSLGISIFLLVMNVISSFLRFRG